MKKKDDLKLVTTILFTAIAFVIPVLYFMNKIEFWWVILAALWIAWFLYDYLTED